MKFLKVIAVVGVALFVSQTWGAMEEGCEGKVNKKSGTVTASSTSYVLPAPRKLNGTIITDTVTITGTSKSVVRDAGNWPSSVKIGMILSIDADTAGSDDLTDWHYIVAIATDTITLDRTHGAVASGACTIAEPSDSHCIIRLHNQSTAAANIVRYKYCHRGEAPPTAIDGESLLAEQSKEDDNGLDNVTATYIWSNAATTSTIFVGYTGTGYINP